MELASSVPVVTGANRGLGRYLVQELLNRGVPKVYALARNPAAIPNDPRVIGVPFDLLDNQSINRAARTAGDVTLLINNASTAAIAGVLEADLEDVSREIATNFIGIYATIRAFLPALEANGDGRIVNVLSMLSLAASPYMAGYSASKAAAHSLTQALRPALAPKGISVHGVYPSTMDTDMVAHIDLPKTSPAQVAAAILDALTDSEEDVFPDAGSKAGFEVWLHDPKAFERALSGAATR